MSLASLDTDGSLAVITIDNPPQNRINEQMSSELLTALDAAEASGSRALLLTTKGPDFSFGGEIMKWPEMSDRQLRATFEQYMSAFNRFEHLPMPVVVAVQGLCFGGGLELAIRADLIIAGVASRFGHAEQTLGIITVLGGVYRAAERAGSAFGSQWSMTSEEVPAATMMQRGVVNQVVPDAELLSAARELTARLAKGPTRAYAAHKALLRTWAESVVAAADNAMLDIAMPLFESDDVQRGIPSAVDALKAGRLRPPMDFTGH
jgi:enoyl-CoA hydratase/carnithine racemase